MDGVAEFKKFHKRLMENAPNGYIPWFFPVIKENKAPDPLAIISKAPPNSPNKSSWKEPHARLTYYEAIQRLLGGGNVGIAARKEDALIIIDIDDYEYASQMPETLTIRSRKRYGFHGFCWKHPEDKVLPLNIPTGHGEIRSSDQYVVAPGSFVKTSIADIEKAEISDELKKEISNDPLLGYYTIEKNIPLKIIKYEELPPLFLERVKKVKENENKISPYKKEMVTSSGEHSALYDLKMEDLISTPPHRREPHPLHESDTGMNFSISNGLAHCWRHSVSLNAIQFLVIKSGYMSCEDAGTGHSGSGAGLSTIRGDDGAIFWAWHQAKKDGIIPPSDKIPIRALKYIVKKYHLLDEIPNRLPIKIYNQALKIVEEKY